MTQSDLRLLLGSVDPDPGCDFAGTLMDEYCELLLTGEPVPDRLAAFLTHIANCTACRQDTESLLDLLLELDEGESR